MTTISHAPDFTLYDLEKSVSEKNYALFEEQLIWLLNFANAHSLESVIELLDDGSASIIHQGLHPFFDADGLAKKKDCYSRLAFVITSYLSDTSHSHRDDVLLSILIYKTFVGHVFYLSCYGDLDHILFNRGLMDASAQLQLKHDEDIRFLYVCLSLHTSIDFDVSLLIDALPDWGKFWYLGMLFRAEHFPGEREQYNMQKLLDACSVIESVPLCAVSVDIAASPWMACSYLDAPNRHALKRSLNIAIESWVNSVISADTLAQIEGYIARCDEVQHIVIASEKYTTEHAVYRSFHPAIKALSGMYKLTLVSAPKAYDSHSSEDFDQVVEVANTAKDLVNTVKKITELKPDLIIYPSLGMSMWTIPLSNLRLAKYQVMGYGHPASAFSDHIDAGIVSGVDGLESIAHRFMESLIISPTSHVMSLHNDYKPFEYTKPDDGVVRIAINSSIQKITNRFLNVCKLLNQNSSVPLEFHFYLIDSRAPTNTVFFNTLVDLLGSNVVVHPPAPYMTYMKNLSNCDLAIGTFPFGGANTNVDLSLLGIPKLYYTEGSDLASFSDEAVCKLLDPPDILVASSEAELAANAIYLIHNPTERHKISESIKDKDLNALFFQDKGNDLDEMLLHVVSAITNSDT